MLLNSIQLNARIYISYVILQTSSQFVYLCRIDRVVEAFMRMVDNPDNNGGVMVVTPKTMGYRHPYSLKGKL